jgi:hypothetical protein
MGGGIGGGGVGGDISGGGVGVSGVGASASAASATETMEHCSNHQLFLLVPPEIKPRDGAMSRSQ